MKNFNENLFKSCIKGKIKFSTSTFVKFLITGTIALSLTACGGGGGGGGSSSVVPPIIEKPDVKPDPEEKPEVNQNENSNGNLITVNQKFNNKGDITLTNNAVGIIGSNSDITNDGDISISNLNTLSNNNYPEIEFETSLAKDCYDELQKEGAKVGIISEKGNVINNGDIKLNGTKNYGIVGVYSNIINNGDIISNNSKDSIGIVNLNGKAENYGTISMTGKVHVDKNSIKSDEVIGMYGYGKDAKIINEGIIELKHEIDLINPYDNVKVEPEYDFDAIGMQVTNGAVAINNKDIIGQGAITGMYANNGSIIKNTGNVKLTSVHYDAKYEIDDNVFTEKFPTYIYGMNGKGEGTKVENTGTIDMIGDGTGIKVADGAEGTNDGTVNLTSQPIKIEGNNAIKYTYLKGMDSRRGSTVTNLKDGIINLNGHGVGIRVRQDSKGYNYGNININSDFFAIGMEASNNGYAENRGNINLKVKNGVGISVTDSGTGTNHKDINILSNYYAVGMEAQDKGNVKNYGNITLKGKNGVGIKINDSGKGYNYGDIISENGSYNGVEVNDNGYFENHGNISITTNETGSYSFGIFNSDSSTSINYKTINTTGKDTVGILATNNATAINEKDAIINVGTDSLGMYLFNAEKESKIINKGTINILGDSSNGMFGNGEGIIKNYGDIVSRGTNSNGIKVNANEKAENFGNISVKDNGTGMLAFDSSSSINHGIITAIGKGSVGMKAFDYSTAINEETGIINVGTGALGMYATYNGVIINKGTINVTEDARGGMLALDGGKIENYGDIKIDKDASDSVYSIYADNDANIKNEGNIITDGDVNIEVGGTYTIGTTVDKTFGKLTGNNINLDGNLVVTTTMAKGSYENSYKLDNMIEGENITLGDSYKNFSDSLLYDLEVSKDKDGNLDGELTRNENNIADFTSNNFSQVGKIFDKYLIKENYDKLSKEDKELVDKIFANTSSNDKVEEAIEKVAGREYLNISRQVFDIKDSFRKYDSSVIATLDKYDCNFNLIGEYGDIQSKDRIVGYDSKMTGFNGAFKLSDSLFGTIGYGYSDIDYDKGAEGKIQTIHGGVYKDYTYNKSNIRLGIFGEYNFHETDRENLFGNVNTDFNSYLVGVTGEISKKYGDSLYIQPKLSLDVAYGSVEKFDENNSLEIKEQDYTSVLPKVEVTVGKDLNNVKLFAKSSYSYELGNLDEDMEITLLNENIKVKNDTMDKGNLNLSVGAEANFESFSLNAELGREFGKRDREYVKAGFSYKF